MKGLTNSALMLEYKYAKLMKGGRGSKWLNNPSINSCSLLCNRKMNVIFSCKESCLRLKVSDLRQGESGLDTFSGH